MPEVCKITSSQFSKVMTTSRGGIGFGKTAISYANEVVMDFLGVEREQITAKSLEWGNIHEFAAIQLYEEQNFVSVNAKKRYTHPKYDFISCEPDGIIGKTGGIEVKCPYNPANHLNNLLENSQIKDYEYQLQGNMWICKLDWIDFVSYDPRFEKPYRIHVKRIERDEKTIKKLEDRCLAFWEIVQERLKLAKKLKL